MVSIERPDGFLISDDPGRIDVDRVHHWLSTDAYWALGRSRHTVRTAIAHSVVFGVYRPSDRQQVGFARLVTDRATFGWLCDVYIDRPVRGRGLGSWLVTTIRDDLASRGVGRLLLATMDAHEVYAPLGFGPLSDPGRWMELDLGAYAVPPTGTDGDLADSAGPPLRRPDRRTGGNGDPAQPTW